MQTQNDKKWHGKQNQKLKGNKCAYVTIQVCEQEGHIDLKPHDLLYTAFCWMCMLFFPWRQVFYSIWPML